MTGGLSSFSPELLFSRIYFQTSIATLKDIIPGKKIILLTDEKVMRSHQEQHANWPTIVVSPGETAKSLPVVEMILNRLMEFGADRDSCLVGIGGGVISDLAGFVAAIYKRGIHIGVVPTTLLAMVDAVIGGKNGINFGGVKNMIGTIRHPDFLIYDFSLLETLPVVEWKNGFAEIIKHACILDATLFEWLEQHSADALIKDPQTMAALVAHNIQLKSSVVREDALEHGRRKILNFGHTVGHAVEQVFQLPHGQAVSVGMSVASKLSAQHVGFNKQQRLQELLLQYDLPTAIPQHDEAILEKLAQDKKMRNHKVDFILLKDIGVPEVQPLSLHEIRSGILTA